MSNFNAVLDILASNRADIEDIVTKLGGVGNVIRMAPSLIHIMQTLAKHEDPIGATERIERVLFYNEETKEKVKAFQRRNGLKPVDGLVGNLTWDKVESLLSKGTGK